MAVGLPLKTTYANGDVYQASDVNDTNGTVNLFQTTLTYSAGKNAIINGGMDIWQRGTSFTNSNGYTADRWYVNRSGGVAGATITQSTDKPTEFQYSLKTQRAAGNTTTNAVDTYYGIESKDSYRFAGKAATLSFYMKVGANFSGSGGSAITVRLLSGTATDAAPFAGSTTVVQTNPAATTSWQRFSITGTFATSITQAFVSIGWVPTGTAGADDSVFITGVQLELGSVATTFSRAGGTIQGELAACQRYYARLGNGSLYSAYAMGNGISTTQSAFVINYPVTLRTTPSAIDYSTLGITDNVAVQAAVTALTLSWSTLNTGYLTATVASGLTQFRPYQLGNQNSVSGFVGFTAEL
jgi:hypothetical protein